MKGVMHTILLRHLSTLHGTPPLKPRSITAHMRLILADKRPLHHGRTGRRLAKGDLGDDIRITDNGTTPRANLLAVILDDMRGRTAGVRTG